MADALISATRNQRVGLLDDHIRVRDQGLIGRLRGKTRGEKGRKMSVLIEGFFVKVLLSNYYDRISCVSFLVYR